MRIESANRSIQRRHKTTSSSRPAKAIRRKPGSVARELYVGTVNDTGGIAAQDFGWEKSCFHKSVLLITMVSLLGSNARSTWINKLALLPTRNLNTSLVHVRSTDVERTLLSAYNFLLGLYPSSSNAVFPIETIDDARENGYPNAQVCPALSHQWSATAASAQYQAYYNSTLAPLAVKYSKLWGTTLTPYDMRALNDIVRARYCHNMPMPPMVTLADAEIMMEAVRVLVRQNNNRVCFLLIDLCDLG
jgi:hypothetical protein